MQGRQIQPSKDQGPHLQNLNWGSRVHLRATLAPVSQIIEPNNVCSGQFIGLEFAGYIAFFPLAIENKTKYLNFYHNKDVLF